VKVGPTLLILSAGFLAGFAVGRLASGPAPLAEEASARNDSASAAPSEQMPSGIGSQADPALDVTTPPTPIKPLDFADLVAQFANLEAGDAAAAEDWDQFTARLQASDLPALAREIIAKYPAPGTEQAIYTVFSELARRSPDTTWQILLEIKTRQLREQAAYAVIGTIADGNISKALALVQALPESNFKTQMRQSALSVLASRDPAKAFELEIQYAGSDSDFSPHSMMYEWVRRDADAAMAAAARLAGPAAIKANEALLQALTGIDPERAWSHAQTLPRHQGDVWQDPRYSVLSTWANTDPLAALKAALSLGDTELQTTAIGEIARIWAESDFGSALSYVVEIGDSGPRAKALAAMAASGQHNRPELFAALLEFGPVGDQNHTHYLIKEWAKEDPRGAADALRQLPPGPVFEQAVVEFARGWISADSAQAKDVVSWVSALPTGGAKSAATRVAFDELARRDAAVASKLLDGVDPAVRKDAAWGLAEGWASAEPAQAAAWAATLPADAKSFILPGVVAQWARRTPGEAAAFAQANDNQGDLVSAVAREWMPYSPDQTGRWVDKLPAGDVRDAGLSAIGQIVSNEDPAAAVLWISRITSVPRREQELQYICSQWVQIDPAAAKAWIGGSNLSAETKASLLR
jgi:hypothetical protein